MLQQAAGEEDLQAAWESGPKAKGEEGVKEAEPRRRKGGALGAVLTPEGLRGNTLVCRHSPTCILGMYALGTEHLGVAADSAFSMIHCHRNFMQGYAISLSTSPCVRSADEVPLPSPLPKNKRW